MAQEQAPQTPLTYRDLLVSEAQKLKIPPELAQAIVSTESSNRMQEGPPTQYGTAQGFFQLLPGTASDMGVDPTDPAQNIRGGLAYFRKLLDENGNNVDQALLRYHGGPNPANHGPLTQAYRQKVMQAWLAGQPQGGAPQGGATDPPPVPPPQAQVATPPPAPSASFVSDLPGWMIQQGIGMAQSFNPMTPTGRRNIAGGVAAGGAAYATGGLSTVPGILAAGARVAAPVLGAATGGMAAETGEQLVGTKPPDLGEIGQAGLEQGAYEGVGQLAFGPLSFFGKHLAARPVARGTLQHFERTKQAMMDRLFQTTQTIRSAFHGAKERGAKSVERAGEAYLSGIAHPPVTPGQAGRAARGIYTGPAKSVKDRLGEEVTEAAKLGPEVPLERVREKIEESVAQLVPSTRIEAAAAEEAAEAVTIGGQPMPPELVERLRAAGRLPAQAAGVTEEAVGLPEGHPLPGILRELHQLATEKGSISFEDAHKYKRLLDEAVNWERSAKKSAEQISKGARQALRSAMGETGYLPYESATRAYDEVAGLFSERYGKTLAKMATEDPSLLVKTIKPDQADSVRMLRELLVEQGGGQKAWDNVRTSWVHENLLKGGIEGISERMAKLQPDFVEEMLGDAQGQTMLRNLTDLQGVYKNITDRAKKELVDVREMGRIQMAVAQGEKRANQAARVAFRDSSIAPFAKRFAMLELMGDIGRVAVLGPKGSIWAMISLARLMVGPNGPDLLMYMANSSKATQNLVKFATATGWGQATPLMFSEITRGLAASMGITTQDLESQQVEVPPGAERIQVATPPPRP